MISRPICCLPLLSTQLCFTNHQVNTSVTPSTTCKYTIIIIIAYPILRRLSGTRGRDHFVPVEPVLLPAGDAHDVTLGKRNAGLI